jgi:hypothetical protein
MTSFAGPRTEMVHRDTSARACTRTNAKPRDDVRRFD